MRANGTHRLTSQMAFREITHLIENNLEQLNYGVAITDIDTDGEFEAVVMGFGYPNVILKRDGEKLVNVAAGLLSDENMNAIGVASGDIDGDGQEEIYFLNTDSLGGEKQFFDRLISFENDKFIDLFALSIHENIRNAGAGRSVVCIDRSGRGQYGFFIANYASPMKYYEMDDNNYLRDIAPELGMDMVTGGRGLIALPIHSDKTDIFAGNEMGPNYLFINQENGQFAEMAKSFGVQDTYEDVRGISALDVNGDGILDLVYGNWNGPHRMFVKINDKFVNQAPPNLAEPSAVRTVIAADLDNDGDDEIFFNNINQPNRLFKRINGEWRRMELGTATEPNGCGTGAAVWDYDNDGTLELLVSHGELEPQALSLYKSVNDNNWIRIMPLTQYGAPARGSLVRLRTKDQVKIKHIDAGSGYLGQMEPVAHFGLGKLAQVDEIEIQWPNGMRKSYPTLEINTFHRIEFPF
tara:strand:+ start:4900 stop:6297 length:1398 start_codon:yes stop_codon:yes gene_type:complete